VLLLLVREWEVRIRGAERVVDIVGRRVESSVWDGCSSCCDAGGDGEEEGCCCANTRSSSAARLCQWKDVRESRAMNASGRWMEGFLVERK
jgi:hypothetical protein